MDQYILGQSEIGSITDDNCEIVLNIELEKNIYRDNVLIYGIVMDCKKKPIENAIITFINKDNEKVGSVYSSKTGFFAFLKIKINSTIRIIIKKTGYKTLKTKFIKLCTQMEGFNIYLKKKPMSNCALISGHLTDNNNCYLEGVTIYLLKRFCNGKTKVYKVTNTNVYGQFGFLNVEKGKYEILINNTDFEIYHKLIKINQVDKIFDINIKLKQIVKNKIVGQVKDYNDVPIANCLVELYKIDDNDIFIRIKCTVCDEKGMYCFIDVPFGNYIVKAKLRNCAKL